MLGSAHDGSTTGTTACTPHVEQQIASQEALGLAQRTSAVVEAGMGAGAGVMCVCVCARVFVLRCCACLARCVVCGVLLLLAVCDAWHDTEGMTSAHTQVWAHQSRHPGAVRVLSSPSRRRGSQGQRRCQRGL